jgi:hypothetical protein
MQGSIATFIGRVSEEPLVEVKPAVLIAGPATAAG